MKGAEQIADEAADNLFKTLRSRRSQFKNLLYHMFYGAQREEADRLLFKLGFLTGMNHQLEEDLKYLEEQNEKIP